MLTQCQCKFVFQVTIQKKGLACGLGENNYFEINYLFCHHVLGGDVVFSCRDESDLRAPVRWVREGGRPLKPGSTDRNGRLEMEKVTVRLVYTSMFIFHRDFPK